MNFDQAKALRLQQWRSTLDDRDFRMQNPEAHRETLHAMATTLATEGLIDKLQHVDMNEMSDAAYWHAVEELQNSPGRYRGPGELTLMLFADESKSGWIEPALLVIRLITTPRWPDIQIPIATIWMP